MKLPFRFLSPAFLAALCCCPPASAGASSVAEPIVDEPPPSYERKPGHYVGDFRVRPSVSISQEYDNNVFSTEHDAVSDWILQVSPLVKADSTGANPGVRFEAGADIGNYWRYTDESFVDYHGRLDLQSDMTPNTALYAGFGFYSDHESRDSADARSGALEPTRFRRTDANMGLKTRHGDVTYQLGVTYETLDFDDTPSADGRISNDDRDRELVGGGLRAAVHMTGESALFAQASYDNRNYGLSTDQSGFRRDSSGYRAAVGITHGFLVKNDVEAYIGLIQQRYHDSRFDDVREVDFGARLDLAPTPAIKATLELQRSLNETTDPGSSGYLSTSLSGHLEYRVSPRLTPYVSLGYGLDEYFMTGRREESSSAGAGAKYFLTRNTFLIAGIRYSSRGSDDSESSAGTNAFHKAVVFLNFTALLYPLSG